MAVHGLASLGTLDQVIRTFHREYAKTPAKLKFVYCLLVGSFPFNAFLAGFFCSVGAFVLTVSLRMQIEAADASGKPEVAYRDYAIAMIILFLAALNYVG
ncbi:hypothetical protein QBZ16_002777 [Prototheca wickerhamii]|uniref:Dolichyl-diphosphooligosaccharide--protein glycosyltransferase subunit DAD1 n=1 Tax=Prototheca wickerhamii TaxID=3111 RepID=A0AAD9IMN5_PROWI|nr:hypothetical protein QBZ16_002777 [Prototheca wickerhamii]